jgi:Mor family transcriptional regulator
MAGSSRGTRGVPQFAENLIVMAAQVLLSHGVARGRAVALSAEINSAFNKAFGGRMIYVRSTRGNESLGAEFEQVVSETLSTQGINSNAVTVISRKIVEAFFKANIGCRLYISLGYRQKIQSKKEQIYAEFDGKNIDELAEKHGLSRMRIYQINAEMRTKHQTGANDGNKS